MREKEYFRIIQDMIAEHIEQIAMPERGVVDSIFPDEYAVRVRLLYDGQLTNKIRVAESYTGNGFGVTNLPEPGDEVLVIFQGGRPNDGYVVGRLYNADKMPPQFTYGDLQIKHKSGSTIRIKQAGDVNIEQASGTSVNLLPNGQIEVNGQNGASVTLKPDGSADFKFGSKVITMDAPTGALKTDAGALPGGPDALVLATIITWLKSHIHPDPVSGFSGPPNLITPPYPIKDTTG